MPTFLSGTGRSAHAPASPIMTASPAPVHPAALPRNRLLQPSHARLKISQFPFELLTTLMLRDRIEEQILNFLKNLHIELRQRRVGDVESIGQRITPRMIGAQDANTNVSLLHTN